LATTEYIASLSIGLRMQKRRKANRDREEDYPKRSEAKIGATYELAHVFRQINFRMRPLHGIVNARNFFKNIVNCDCLHADIVAADRLSVVVSVHARTARDAGPQGVAFGDRAANSAGVSGPNNETTRIGVIEAK
jgi:hypothetical protein